MTGTSCGVTGSTGTTVRSPSCGTRSISGSVAVKRPSFDQNSLKNQNRMGGKDNTSLLMVHRHRLVQTGFPSMHHTNTLEPNRHVNVPSEALPTPPGEGGVYHV